MKSWRKYVFVHSPSGQERCADQIETKMGQLAEKQNQGDLKAFFKSYDRNSASAAGTAPEGWTYDRDMLLIIQSTVDHGGISTVVWWLIRDQRGPWRASIAEYFTRVMSPFNSIHSRQSMAPILVNLGIGRLRFTTLIIVNQCSNSNSWHV